MIDHPGVASDAIAGEIVKFEHSLSHVVGVRWTVLIIKSTNCLSRSPKGLCEGELLYKQYNITSDYVDHQQLSKRLLIKNGFSGSLGQHECSTTSFWLY